MSKSEAQKWWGESTIGRENEFGFQLQSRNILVETNSQMKYAPELWKY